MKSLKSWICIALCVAIVCSCSVFFTSCGDNGGGLNAETREEQIELEKSKTFQVMQTGVDRSNEEYSVVKAMNEFEKTYNRKIEFVTSGYDEGTQKVMASLASGKPIDVVNAGNYEFPLYAMKKYAQPIDELVDMNSEYIDKGVADVFTYQGKHYVAASQGSSNPLVIYYNKTLFENEGLEDLMDLYTAGEWTTDKLKEVCMKFTRDTNGDGVYDQWGMTAWYQWVFFGSCAASVCKINDQGLFELNLDNNPNLVEALELIQSAWHTDKWLGTEGDSIYTSFYQQKNAMLNEFTWAGTNILKAKNEGQFAFDVGCAPFPWGKCNTEKVNYCFMSGFAILNGCACPYSAGALLDMIMKYDVTSEPVVDVPQEWLDLYAELRKKPFNSSIPDNAVDSGKALCSKVGGGTDIQAAMEIYKSMYQGLVDEANKIPQDRVDHDFTTIELDFSKGGTDGIVKASDAPSVEISNPGDGLKIAMDYTQYVSIDETCYAAKTDPEKYPVWGYKGYKVTFEYKLDADIPGEISVYKFELKRDGISNGTMSVFVPDPAAVGNWQTGEVELEGVGDNEALSVYIAGMYANTINIKNLKIEEIKE